jgi:hypothetical protein
MSSVERKPTNKPEFVRVLTYEELTPEQLERVASPRSRGRLPETIHRYDPFRDFDDSIESFHRPKLR